MAGLLASTLVWLSPAVANGENRADEQPRGTYVMRPHIRPRPMFSHPDSGWIIYMNRDGGQYSSSWSEDSRQNQSTIVGYGSAQMSAYPFGENSWGEVMRCMRNLYADFDVLVTDEDPGDTPHVEVVVSGSPADIGMGYGIGGVAPFTCGVIDNAIVYVFPETYGDYPQGICEAAGQETAHAFGLDHGYLCEDIMTYLAAGPDGNPCGPKRFVDQDVSCGEYSERGCQCGEATQNSYRYLMDVLGEHPSARPPSVSITAPAEGASVQPGFAIEVDASDDEGVSRVELMIDGELVDTDSQAPWSFVAPSDLVDGEHEIEVRAFDSGARSASAAQNVTVVRPGGSDPDNRGDPPPLDDDPGSIVDPGELGNFGDSCARGDMCASSACVTISETNGYCTEACSADACPYGFACEPTEQGAYCLLADSEGPGFAPGSAGLGSSCASAGPTSAGSTSTMLVALGVALAFWRRRRA